MPSPTPHSRTLGALLGVHCGDSLGATCEFMPWESLRQKYPEGVKDIVGGGPFQWKAGHATDDTDLTRAVALAYRDVHQHRVLQKEGDPPDVTVLSGNYMLDWYSGNWPGRTPGNPPVDVGGATATALTKLARTKDPAKSGAGIGQAGNGSLMRCIPTALFQPSASLRNTESSRISNITHDDPRCAMSCAVYNTIVAALVSGSSVEVAMKKGEDRAKKLEDIFVKMGEQKAKFFESNFGTLTPVTTALKQGRELKVREMAENGPKDLRGKGGGFVLESLTIAISALLDERPLEEVLIDVVRIGKDTDTNAAIAGGLLGARDGVEGIPQRWKEKLQFAKEFEDLVNELVPA